MINLELYRYNTRTQNYTFPEVVNVTHVGRGDARYDVLELFCGFDVETTNIETDDGRHLAFVYHLQFSIFTQRRHCVYLFRKWSAFLAFLEAFIKHYNLGPKTHALCGVANLSFEFQFLRRRLQWDVDDWAFFAKEQRQPLKATYKGLEFREVLSMTGGSLAQLAKDYCTTQKLVRILPDGTKESDLDYSKIRNSKTKMDPVTEEQYCINDVVIISEFMFYLFNNYIRPEHYIPMTFTGVLMKELEAELKSLCWQRDDKNGLAHGTSYDGWRDFIQSILPDQETYVLWFKYLFRGGYVHANALYTNVDGLFAHMRDVTSHYPTRMNLDYFPMSAFKRCEFSEERTKHECLIIHCVFDYIRTTTSHTIESKNRIVWSCGAHFDNGRLMYADSVEVYLTEKDYEIYKMFYAWEGMTVLECWTAKRGKLPPYIINRMNMYYQKKERLKRMGLDHTTEYAITKARLNTFYGAMVKRLRLLQWTYDNDEEWHQKEEKLDYDKAVSKLILAPQWGIWVTAAARLELTKLLYKLTQAGVACYYCDTDSIKYKPSHKAEQIIKHYNISIKHHVKNRGLRSTYFNGLGELTREEYEKNKPWAPVRFKTLGAKRYIYEKDGVIKATVAGMPKTAIKHIGDDVDDIFRNFNIMGFSLNPEESEKLTTSYTDEDYEYMVDGELMKEKSGVSLFKIPFKIKRSQEYIDVIRAVQHENERKAGLL